MKNSKKKLSILLWVSGIIFLCAGIFLSARATDFQRNGVKTQAEIVLIDREYDANDREEITVYVTYSVGNTTYTQKLDYYASRLYVGASVPIYYLPDDPATITYAKAQYVPPVLFYVGAGICLGFGIFSAITSVRGDGRLKSLKENGQKRTAVIKKFEYKKNTRIFGKHPATLTCADASGNSYKIKFPYNYERPVQIGDPVTIYVDAANEKKYAVDIREYLTGERKTDAL